MALYYIQDTRGGVGNCVMWWKADSNGYTTELGQAGKYSGDEARKIEALRGTDKPWPCDLIDDIAVRHVRIETLRNYVPDPTNRNGGGDQA